MSVFSSRQRADRTPAAVHVGRLSVLARGLHVVGEIESNGIVTIEGHLDGIIRGSPQVFVAPGGVVVGDVSANEVVVGGRVEGDIAATMRIELQAGAVVQGNVTAPRIVVHEGGEVNGRFRMRIPAASHAHEADALRLSA